MATGQVIQRRRGFTLLELLTVVAIVGVLAALSVTAWSSSQKISRVSGQARLLVQRLQSTRANAVSQGNAQGYYIGPNGVNVTVANAHQAFVFYKLNPLETNVVFDSVNDRLDPYRDWLPTVGNTSALLVEGANGTQAAPISIGFDLNGLPTVSPAGVFPYCLKVTDLVEPSMNRRVILFDDGTVKVQKDENYCP